VVPFNSITKFNVFSGATMSITADPGGTHSIHYQNKLLGMVVITLLAKDCQRALVDESGFSRNCARQRACHTLLKAFKKINKFQQPNKLLEIITS
jgi:hypothetical protein